MTDNAPPREKPAKLPATPTASGALAIIPQGLEDVWRLATLLSAAGNMVPPDYRGKPEATALAIMWGMELGVSPVQALQGIVPINGRASVWGDLALALVKRHPDFVGLPEVPMLDGAGGIIGYTVTAQRRGTEDVVRSFTLADAARAGLIAKAADKGGPWRDYPQRMLLMRARSWAMRDQFPDALRGLSAAEEMRDTIDLAPGDYRDVSREPKPAADPIPEPRARAAAIGAPTPDPILSAVVQSAAAAAPEPEPEPEPRHAPADDAPMPQARKADREPAEPEPEPVTGELLPRDEAPASSAPLGRAQAAHMRALIDTLEGIGVSEQDLHDELGGFVNRGNFARAVSWCEARLSGAPKP